MLDTQRKFFDYLDEVKTELDKANSSGLFKDIEKSIRSIEPLKQSIAQAELIVPMVGAFSAGKSTLINSFLGSGLLPVDITPETALATELRYSEREYIEAVKANDESEHLSIAEISAINEKAEQYKYVKVFLDSEPLKGILPLVLVDMPGFDSPLDLHHRAILTYLDRGSHYAVLISVEEGTVTQSIHRQLSEIHEFDKEFSVFLSKANLRSNSDVENIAENIRDILEDDFDFDNSVVPVSQDGGESLEKMLNAIDPEELFGKLWCPKLESHFFSLDGSLNTWISSLKKDQTENEKAISELDSSLRNLQRKKEEMIQDVRRKYSTTRINSIVERVGADLDNSVEELTDIAVSSGEDAFQRSLSEILRTSISSNVKTEMERLNEQIVEDLSSSLKSVDSSLSSYTNDEYTLEKFVQTSQSIFKGVEVLSKVASAMRKGRNLYRVFATTVAIATNIVAPVVELILVFLPDLLGYFQKQKQKEQIRNQLVGTVIPSIKNKLRSELPTHFNEQVNLLINEQAELLDSQIRDRQSEIAEAEKAKREAIQDVEQTIAELTSIRENIRALANQVVFTQ